MALLIKSSFFTSILGPLTVQHKLKNSNKSILIFIHSTHCKANTHIKISVDFRFCMHAIHRTNKDRNYNFTTQHSTTVRVIHTQHKNKSKLNVWLHAVLIRTTHTHTHTHNRKRKTEWLKFYFFIFFVHFEFSSFGRWCFTLLKDKQKNFFLFFYLFC